jgi:hypothetical protein
MIERLVYPFSPVKIEAVLSSSNCDYTASESRKETVTLSVRLDAQRRELPKGQNVLVLQKCLLRHIIGVGIGTCTKSRQNGGRRLNVL